MMFRPSRPESTLIAPPLDPREVFDAQLQALLAQAAEPRPAGAGRRKRRLAVLALRPDAPSLAAARSRLSELDDAGVELSVILGRTWPSDAAIDPILETVGADAIRLARFRGASALHERTLFGAVAEWTGPKLAEARRSERPHAVRPSGRLDRFEDGRAGVRRMAKAHARFEDIWASARTI